MTIQSTLQSFGINEKAARLYLALLGLGTASVAAIANQAGVKRPTTYVLLDELKRRGLVSEQQQGRIRLFTATKPEALKDRLEEKVREFTSALPSLQAMVATQVGRPTVEVLEGREAVTEAYFDLFAQPGEVVFFSDIDTLREEFGSFLAEFNQRLKREGKLCRELVGNTLAGRRYVREAAADAPLRQTRLLAEPIANDTAIVGDTVLIVSFKANNYFVVRIQNTQIAASYRSLFEQLWQLRRG